MELNQSQASKNQATSESEIRKVIADMRAAMNDRDVDRLMTFYADDVIAFDIIPPLQYTGKAAYKKSWVQAFEACSDSPDATNETLELKITVNDNLAFTHSINHNEMVSENGEKMKMWMRATNCFKKIEGKWLIVHEQFSVPVDFESGKALFELQPASKLH